MKQWQRILAVLAASAGLGLLGAATPATAAADAPKKLLAADPNAKDLILKGDAKCTGCHDEADEPTGAGTMLELNPGVLAIGKTKHGVKADKRTPTCTDCHGESDKHRLHKGSDKPPVVDRSFRKNSPTSADARNETCMTSHKGGNRMQWEGSQHANGEAACNSCHQVHSKKDKVRDKVAQSEVCFTCHKQQRAETLRSSTHPVKAGGVACSNCHNVHGSNGPKLLVKNTTNETCWTCHAEKRGPFLWEHPSASDDCMNCHSPHGSNQPTLLKVRQPYLCSSCHIAGGHSTTGIRSGNDLGAAVTPGGAVVGALGGGGIGGAVPGSTSAASQMVGKSCTNCHTEVHGSNHPSGARFAR
jgi:DmsE family decaheme c-type cytochrome